MKISRIKIFTLIFAISASCLSLSMLGNIAFADETTRPTVIMESYVIVGDITAGGDFILEYTLRNTSRTTSVNNIIFAVNDSSGVFYPAENRSNQYYIAHIDAEQSYTGQAFLSVNKNASSGGYNLSFNLTYQSAQENGAVLSNSGYITLTISSLPLAVTDLSISEQVIQGRTTYISIRYENAEDIEMRNANVVIEGNIEDSGKQQSIGVIKGKATGAVDGYVAFTASGEQLLTIWLEYESADGSTIKTEPLTALTSVVAATDLHKINNELSLDPENTENVQQYMIRFIRNNAVLILATAVIVCVATIIIYTAKRRK